MWNLFASDAFVCPFCFDEHSFRDVKFRCGQLYRCLGGAPIFQVPEVNGRRPLLKEARCPAEGCGRPTRIRLCPSCEGQLPSQLGECTSLTLGLLGAKFTGKSQFVGVLIDRIRKRLATSGNPFNCSFRLEGDASRIRYENDFERYLFKERVTIPETIAGSANASVLIPVASQLRFSGKLNFFQKLGRWRWQDRLEPVRDVQMSFFDTAGEALVGADIMSAECRYLGNAQGLILLLDPLQIPSLREKLIQQGRLPSHRIPPSATSPWTLLEALIEVLRAKQRKTRDRLEVPLAVAFSKCDELDTLLPPGHPARPTDDGKVADESSSCSDGRFDWMAHNNVQDQAAAMLVEHGCGNMLTNLRDHFEKFSLFFVSSLGHPPDQNGSLKELNPRRVLDPFLWLLAIHGVIPSTGICRNPEF